MGNQFRDSRDTNMCFMLVKGPYDPIARQCSRRPTHGRYCYQHTTTEKCNPVAKKVDR